MPEVARVWLDTGTPDTTDPEDCPRCGGERAVIKVPIVAMTRNGVAAAIAKVCVDCWDRGDEDLP